MCNCAQVTNTGQAGDKSQCQERAKNRAGLGKATFWRMPLAVLDMSPGCESIGTDTPDRGTSRKKRDGIRRLGQILNRIFDRNCRSFGVVSGVSRKHFRLLGLQADYQFGEGMLAGFLGQ